MARDLFGRDLKSKRRDDAEIRVTDRRRIQLDDNEAPNQSTAPVEAPNLKPSYVEELEARAQSAEQKALEVQARFDQLRKQLQNETDQTRQRLNRAADERAQREKADFIAALLPVLDNLERATEAAATASTPEVIAEGIRQTASSFENALAAAGVEPIEAVGEVFDPQFHEAIETVETTPENEGRVIAEHTRGYKIGDRLLRPARVKVGRSSAKANQAAE
ncbi:MAG TPA: nucleotide exchange factor GrpE [Pyrinomonadaceae bacterium]|jgi:molecular chaperone GrpE|nr:nucleotide exchange factor GrpE [Pyrinomonadaceae bacterium]